MDINLLQIVGNWLSILAVSTISLFGFDTYKEDVSTTTNNSYTKNVSVINTIVPYDTKYVYNSSIPANAGHIILSEGIEGITYTYPDGTTKVLREAVSQVVEVGTGSTAIYTGTLTGYGPDCKTCNGKGIVGCPDANGVYRNIITDGIYYNDSEYGEVRILAADLSGFPCGTIILVNNGRLEPFLGVVLDTGSTMRNAWANGKVWMDLAFKTEADPAVYTATKMDTTTFSVQRWGW